MSATGLDGQDGKRHATRLIVPGERRRRDYYANMETRPFPIYFEDGAPDGGVANGEGPAGSDDAAFHSRLHDPLREIYPDHLRIERRGWSRATR